jgi:hypothetical protein
MKQVTIEQIRNGRKISSIEMNFPDDMDYLFGTVLEIDFPDDVNSVRIDDNYNIYYITRNMLIENEMPKPNYLPKRKRNETLAL